MNSSVTYDCIAIGAGPAGASAAYHLAKGGRSILLLDKDPLGRAKPCAGGVSPAIAQWFDFDFSPAISTKANVLQYTWKLDDPVDVTLKTAEPMWMVRREVFDRFLVEQAQARGAEFRGETAVSGIEFNGNGWQVRTRDGETFSARYLIGADGANGPVAGWLGLKPGKPRTAAILEAEGADADKMRFELGSLKNGFIWSFPKADGYSIAGGTCIGGDSKKVSQTVAEYARKLGYSGRVVEHPLCLWDGDRVLNVQNALLAGDAAYVGDPLTAEGIRPAIFTGVKAAAAIEKSLSGDPNALADYSRAIADEWGAQMAWAQRLAGAFYRFPGIAYKVAVKKPTATQTMLEILCGELAYGEVAKSAIDRITRSFLPGRS